MGQSEAEFVKKGCNLTLADLTPFTAIDGLLALRPLFIDCHPMYWWAEPLEMARRLALTSVTLMFQDSANVLLFSLFVNCLSIVWCVPILSLLPLPFFLLLHLRYRHIQVTHVF